MGALRDFAFFDAGLRAIFFVFWRGGVSCFFDMIGQSQVVCGVFRSVIG